MGETIKVGNFSLNFEHEYKNDVFLSRDVEMLGECNASICFPIVDEALPESAHMQLDFLRKKYPTLKREACEAIAFLGCRAGTWPVELDGLPPLVLVKAVLREKTFQSYTTSYELFYTDPVNDVYGLWSVEFVGTTVFGVRRSNW